MQKSWRLVLFTTIELILFSPSAFGIVLLEESKIGDNFDFHDLNHVFLAITLPDNEAFLHAFKTDLGSLGSLKILKGSFNETLDAMAKSSFWLFVSMKRTKNPNITLLEVSAKASSETIKNRANFNGIVWNRFFILENETQESLRKIVQDSTKQFLSHYFETNPQSKGKAVFYYPDPESDRSDQGSM